MKTRMRTRGTGAWLLALSSGLVLGAAPLSLGQDASVAAPAEAGVDVKKVYVMELKGHFGEDISETPIKAAINDAKRLAPDYLIVILNNDWTMYEGLEKLGDDVIGMFDQLFKAEDMAPLFTSDIQREWEKPPELVFWVKNAMGGAAFLPLVSPNIYFSPEGKMGGVGGVEEMLKGGGDEVVVQKQLSLRLKHAEGMAISGGHAPQLIEAMCLNSYVLSVRYNGDEPEYLERMPENNSEYLLTDDGKDSRIDSDADRTRGKGDDILTITSETARKLKLSKGTAATLDDLLFELGISRNHEVVKNRSASIMESWSDGIASFSRDLRSLWKDFEKIAVQGTTLRERNKLRGQQISKLEAMQKIIKKYKEAMNPRRYGMPTYEDLSIMIERIRNEMRLDK